MVSAVQFRFCSLLLGVALTACASAPSPTGVRPTDPRWTALDHDIPDLLKTNQVASVSIARVEHGELVATAAYGFARAGVPATPATLYNVASLTKPITAEVVLQLAARGKLTLDESLSATWIDPDLLGDPRHRQLTPRLALSHRTGFPNWRRDIGGRLAFQHDPGEVGYSGEGFEYLARIIEKKTNDSLDKLADKLVFAPAGMTETSFVHEVWFGNRVAIPTRIDGTTLSPTFVSKANAADLVYSTARDYARFLVSVMHHTGLPPALEAERDKVQVSTLAHDCPQQYVAACPRDAGFGLGWQVMDFPDAKFLMHTGKDTGVATFAYVNLTEQSATVILTNSDGGLNLVIPILEHLNVDQELLAYLRAQS
jgi:CubicO group peptidase (beta-lactamase class C family)